MFGPLATLALVVVPASFPARQVPEVHYLLEYEPGSWTVTLEVTGSTVASFEVELPAWSGWHRSRY